MSGEVVHSMISMTHHILPVQHLQDGAEQLAARLQILLPLQVVLELVRHHGEQDLSTVWIKQDCQSVGNTLETLRSARKLRALTSV